MPDYFYPPISTLKSLRLLKGGPRASECKKAMTFKINISVHLNFLVYVNL